MALGRAVKIIMLIKYNVSVTCCTISHESLVSEKHFWQGSTPAVNGRMIGVGDLEGGKLALQISESKAKTKQPRVMDDMTLAAKVSADWQPEADIKIILSLRWKKI